MDKSVVSGVIIVLLALNAFFEFKGQVASNQILKHQESILEINQEAFLGDLLFQYYGELQACLNAGVPEEDCKSELDTSELVQKIDRYGGSDFIK